jgi:hypothetical protein
VQFPSSTTRSRLIVDFVAGAVGGAVAIALMELLAGGTHHLSIAVRSVCNVDRAGFQLTRFSRTCNSRRR